MGRGVPELSIIRGESESERMFVVCTVRSEKEKKVSGGYTA